MDRIRVEKKGKESQRYPGVAFHTAFETETDQVGEVRLAAKTAGGWHHHGKRILYGYVVSGRPVLEFGLEGKEKAILSPGDFFQVPPELVHRDVNPQSEEAVMLIFNIGQGPSSYPVPEPSKK